MFFSKNSLKCGLSNLARGINVRHNSILELHLLEDDVRNCRFDCTYFFTNRSLLDLCFDVEIC